MKKPTPDASMSGPATTAPLNGVVRGRDALRGAIEALIREAQRELRLRAPRLDDVIFGSSAIADALAAFATRHPRNRALVLIDDATTLKENERLLAVARRLSDRVELREADETDRGAYDLCLMVDRTVHMTQTDITRSDSVIVRQAPATARLIEPFNAAWDRGTRVALRTLGL
jgi:sugar-specific transcriptional regulator TrmB